MSLRTGDLGALARRVVAERDRRFPRDGRELRVGVAGYDPVVRALLVRRLLLPGMETVDGEEHADLGDPDLYVRVEETRGEARARDLVRRIVAGTARPGELGHWSAARADGGRTSPLPPAPGPAPDVWFVPLAGFGDRVRLRFMTEYGADFALWDDDGEHAGELEDLLPIEESLRTEIRAWARAWLRHDGGEERIEDWTRFTDRGRTLAALVQRQLGEQYRVRYLAP